MSLFAFLHGLLREHLAAVGRIELPMNRARNRWERKRTERTDWETILPKVMDRLPQGTTVPQLRETLAAWHAGQQLSCNSVSPDDPIACRLQSLDDAGFEFELRSKLGLIDRGRKTAAKGVALKDAASILCEGDKKATGQLMRRWHGLRDPKKPAAMGKDSNHSQRWLYLVADLAAWVEEVEGADVVEGNELLKRLRQLARAPRPQKPSAPSAKSTRAKKTLLR